MKWGRRGKKRHGILLAQPEEGGKRCASCGGACCRGFPSVELTWDEYVTLKRLGATRLQLTLTGSPLLLIDYCCEFLENGRCAIYDDRPDICRRFSCHETE